MYGRLYETGEIEDKQDKGAQDDYAGEELALQNQSEQDEDEEEGDASGGNGEGEEPTYMQTSQHQESNSFDK